MEFEKNNKIYVRLEYVGDISGSFLLRLWLVLVLSFYLKYVVTYIVYFIDFILCVSLKGLQSAFSFSRYLRNYYTAS